MGIICYTHDYENDTTYTFEPGAERSQITMTFTSEDPDYGTEELIYGGDGTEQELRKDLLNEISECLDKQEDHVGIPSFLKYYDENFCRTSLIAFEGMLIHLSNKEV